MLTIDGSWVWDFWIADDGVEYHLFYLHAPTSLVDPRRRHRAARIGHAVSDDLQNWTVVDESVLDTGAPDDFDATATWTGSVVRGDDGMWRMFYTGSRFLGPEPEMANVEAIGVAVSGDLRTWTKTPGPVVVADPRWYETWEMGTWKEEAWRDPWVFKDPAGSGWHMLITARANHGAIDDRGVIGHAFSQDLVTWEVRTPLTRPGEGFAHLEVPQVAAIDGRWVLLFSSAAGSMTAEHASDHPDPGTWAVLIDDPTRPFLLAAARPVTSEALYSGRVIQGRNGGWQFLAFHNDQVGRGFAGGISDPFPFHVPVDAALIASRAAVVRRQ